MSYNGQGSNWLTTVSKSGSELANLAAGDEILVQSAGDKAVPLCGGANSIYTTSSATTSTMSCTDLGGDDGLQGAAPAFLDSRTKDYYLIVGETSVTTPGTPSPQGTFPGSDPAVESTFLVAPGYGVATPSGTSNGSSFAAPVVQASIADVRAAYPGLTGAQVRKILLDTADTSFSTEYQKNTCGPSGTTKCGKYYFGMGILNVEAALKLAANVAAGIAQP